MDLRRLNKLDCSIKAILGRKPLPGTNTLAYYHPSSLGKKKSFIVMVYQANCESSSAAAEKPRNFFKWTQLNLDEVKP
jgi:hypothetical protein